MHEISLDLLLTVFSQHCWCFSRGVLMLLCWLGECWLVVGRV